MRISEFLSLICGSVLRELWGCATLTQGCQHGKIPREAQNSTPKKLLSLPTKNASY